MTKITVEFKVVKDLDSYGCVRYYVHANKDLIGIEINLRHCMRVITHYIKGLEIKQKEGLPKIVYTDSYSYEKNT